MLVLWYCWLGLLTCKNRRPYCVGGDVKPCSIINAVLSPVRLYVRPSHRWISQKRLRLWSCDFHRTVAHPVIPFSGWVSARNPNRFPLHNGVKRGWSRENKLFLGSCVNISKKLWLWDTSKLLLMTNRKSHMRFRLTPRLMTLMTMNCHKFKFSRNFAWFCRSVVNSVA